MAVLAHLVIYGEPIRLVAPAVLPVDFEDAKAQSRITSDAEILVLDRYIREAVEEVENWTGLGLITQTWTQTFPAFSGDMILWRRPLRAVTGVVYFDEDGQPQLLDPENYQVIGVGGEVQPGRLRLASGGAWPATHVASDAITVTYSVGYGASPVDVPALIRGVILSLVATRFEFREQLHVTPLHELPENAKSQLYRWRPLTVA